MTAITPAGPHGGSPDTDLGPLPCPTVAGLGSLAHDERITLMGLLVETHARLTRALGAELETACGLPLSWYDVLIRLGRSPDGHLTMTQLAAEVSLDLGRHHPPGRPHRRGRATSSAGAARPTGAASTSPSPRPGPRKLEEATAEHLEGLDRHLLGPLDPDDRAALGDGPAQAHAGRTSGPVWPDG